MPPFLKSSSIRITAQISPAVAITRSMYMAFWKDSDFASLIKNPSNFGNPIPEKFIRKRFSPKAKEALKVGLVRETMLQHTVPKTALNWLRNIIGRYRSSFTLFGF